MTRRIQHTETKPVSSEQRNKQTPTKKFSVRDDKKDVHPSPLQVFQTSFFELAQTPPEESCGVGEIDEIYMKLCDTVEYTVSNGVEETTVTLSKDLGEVTLKKYDTAPMQFHVSLHLSPEMAARVAPHIPSLTGRLEDQFEETEFHIAAGLHAQRTEEKTYKVRTFS